MKGYILIEASLLSVILSLAIVSLMPVFILTIRANKMTERRAVAAQMATELLEEIGLRRWDQSTPNPPQIISNPSSLGVDSGKNPLDKTTFTDVDDFNGWNESPPQDPLGRPLSVLTDYTRTVTVRYVDSNFNSSSGKTDYKQVTVCTQWPKASSLCLDTVFTNR